MPTNSLISMIYKIKSNIKLYLGFATIAGFLYMYLFISTALITTFNKRPDPLFDYLKTLNYKIVVSLLLLLSIFLTSIIYALKDLESLTVNPNDKIHQYSKRAIDYYPILPLFMISLGFMLMTFYMFNNLFSTFGSVLFLIGIFMFYIMVLIKTNYESKIHYTLLKANEALKGINPNDKKVRDIEKFNKFFTKYLNNIDRNLKRGVRINDIQKEDNSPMPIKSAIIHYLPVFIQYGKNEQIYSLNNHINKMLDLVYRNGEFDLNVSSVILDIYRDIEKFLKSNQYKFTEQRWRVKLSIINNDSLMVVGVTLSIVYKLLEYVLK